MVRAVEGRQRRVDVMDGIEAEIVGRLVQDQDLGRGVATQTAGILVLARVEAPEVVENGRTLEQRGALIQIGHARVDGHDTTKRRKLARHGPEQGGFAVVVRSI